MKPEEALHRLKAPLKDIKPNAVPFAAVLTCSDPRLCPELLFGCNLGELFVVRTAGHVLTPEVEESLAFALLNMAIPLIVVLGHENCLAIKAAEDNAYPDWELCKQIKGTATEYSESCQKRLCKAEPFKSAIAENKLQIVAAHLSFQDQAINWL